MPQCGTETATHGDKMLTTFAGINYKKQLQSQNTHAHTHSVLIKNACVCVVGVASTAVRHLAFRYCALIAPGQPGRGVWSLVRAGQLKRLYELLSKYLQGQQVLRERVRWT